MSTDLLTILSVLEIVLLVVVLALFLILLATRLGSIAANLGALDGAVARIEKDLGILKVGAPMINNRLEPIVGALPGIAEKAERVAGTA